MKITQKPVSPEPKQALKEFSKKQFTLELNGFQLVALLAISRRVGGSNALRQVFSDYDGTGDDFVSTIQAVPEAFEAYQELARGTRYANDQSGIFIKSI